MELPRFEDYGVSPITGFLPDKLPLQRLPFEYNAWEDVVKDLNIHIETQQLRTIVDKMPLLQAGKLASVQEQRRAYSILGFLTHAYVWSPPKVCNRIPRQLSEPLLTLSQTLGLPPLATYAGLCLWNFKTIDAEKTDPIHWNLKDLVTLQSYTGCYDEAWFYLISVAMERQGGPCLDNGLAALRACYNGDEKEVADRLDRLSKDIEELTNIMMRMSECLDPAFFYHRMRPFLAGWKGMESAGLPDGLYYGDETEPRVYAGGSNGQSSLIQALDIILNIEHHALGQRTPPAPVSKPAGQSAYSASKPSNNAFLLEMRNYMPREHREFLQVLENCAVMRPFVLSRNQKQLTASYDNCLQTLRTFRSKHIQIVMRYISLQARANSQPAKGIGLSGSKGKGGETGTGGTDLMPFLKQTRDEVSDAAAGDWNKSILSDVTPKKGENIY